jgi:glutaconyl-CoA/methylmalonyl-CoA decarboxylase subunit gamma
MRYFVTFPSGDEVPVDVDHLPTGELSITVAGRRISADAVALGATTSMRIDGRVVDLWMEGAPPGVGVIARGHRFYATAESERMRALAASVGHKGGGAGDGTLSSPMPGRVLKVLVAEGDEVTVGTALVVVEAMKMENELGATRAGKVRKVHVTAGQTVESGARLVEIG